VSIYVSIGMVTLGLIALFAFVGVKFGKGCRLNARGVSSKIRNKKTAAVQRGESIAYLEDCKRRKDDARETKMREDHLRRISIVKGGAIRRKSRKVGSKKSGLAYNQNYLDFVIDPDRNPNTGVGRVKYTNHKGHNTNMDADGTGYGTDANGIALEESSSASLARRRQFQRTLAEWHDWQAWYEDRRDPAGKKKKPGMTAAIHKKSPASTIVSGQNSAVDREALETDADATLQDAQVDHEVETETSEDDEPNVAVTQRDAEPGITTETSENRPDETAIRRRLPADAASSVDSEETASWTSDEEKESEEEDDLDDSKFLDPDGKA